MEKYDLHIHSNMSDGTHSPAELPGLAAAAGVRLMALTDHDTAGGAAEALAAGAKVIPGMEIDADYPCELHILALGIDPAHPAVAEYEAWRREGRLERNERILAKLAAMGVYIRELIEHSRGNDTRLHLAKALIKGGYAESLGEAFERYLGSGAPAYVPGVRIGRREAIELCHRAGGVAALAHPCKMKGDVNRLAAELAGWGLWGIEAFYPGCTGGKRQEFLTMAKRYGLLPTCGSDFHGANRPGNALGAAWEPHPALEGAWEFFMAR